TNHLDLESREALEAALEAFPGTVLLVSHDRALVDAVAERTLAIEEGTVRSYDGGWADYVQRREERMARAGRPEREPKAPPKLHDEVARPRGAHHLHERVAQCLPDGRRASGRDAVRPPRRTPAASGRRCDHPRRGPSRTPAPAAPLHHRHVGLGDPRGPRRAGRDARAGGRARVDRRDRLEAARARIHRLQPSDERADGAA